MSDYGRVLLSHFPVEASFPGFTMPDGSPRPSLVGMILEAFVSLSVTEIVADKGARATIDEQAPRSLRRRVTYIDRADSDAKHAAFFAPIGDELGVTLIPNRRVTEGSRELPSEVLEALSITYLLTGDFFVALDHRVQVQMPAAKMVPMVSSLREFLRSSDNRARLATLEGVLRLYGDATVPGLVPHDLRTSAVVGTFSDILRDDLYQSLSENAYALGIPLRARSALRSMRRIVHDMLTKPAVRDLFDLGSNGLEIATKLPVPDSRQATELLGANPYLPPLADVMSPINRAYEAFKALPPVPQSDATS